MKSICNFFCRGLCVLGHHDFVMISTTLHASGHSAKFKCKRCGKVERIEATAEIKDG